jgi:hypothetical protein
MGKTKRWSESEILILKEHYGKMPNAELVKLLNDRSEGATVGKANKIGLKTSLRWSKKEKELMVLYYNKIPKNEMQKKMPNRNWIDIVNMGSTLKLSNQHEWEDYEDNIIRDNWENLNDYEICEILKQDKHFRTKRSVKWRRQMLGLNRVSGYSIGTISKSKNGDICHSIDEKILINFIIDNGFDYKKDYNYSDLLINDSTNRTCDVVIFYENNRVAIEYFGLYRKTPRNKIEEAYSKKVDSKLHDFNNKMDDVIFIPLYPDDIEKRDAIRMKKIILNLKGE